MSEQTGEATQLTVLHGQGRAENMGTMPPGFQVKAAPDLEIVGPDYQPNRGGWLQRLRQRPPVTVALLFKGEVVRNEDSHVEKVRHKVEDLIDKAKSYPAIVGHQPSPRPTAS